MMPIGAVNAWKCERCGKLTIAEHVDSGTTPMFLACRVTPGCQGRAISAGYPKGPIPDHIKDNINFEWYEPSHREMRTLDYKVRVHVERGGLLIREKVKPTESDYMKAKRRVQREATKAKKRKGKR